MYVTNKKTLVGEYLDGSLVGRYLDKDAYMGMGRYLAMSDIFADFLSQYRCAQTEKTRHYNWDFSACIGVIAFFVSVIFCSRKMCQCGSIGLRFDQQKLIQPCKSYAITYNNTRGARPCRPGSLGLENYAMSVTYRSHLIGEHHGMLKYRLHTMDIPWVAYTTTSIKVMMPARKGTVWVSCSRLQ
jgi:hypothetical protein